MTYNIGYLSGMTNNLPVKTTADFFDDNLRKVNRVFSIIQPDFIGFQEIDFCSKRSFYRNQLDSLAQHTSYGYAALAVNWDKNYVPFPYWPPAAHFGRVLSGQALLSRYPIESQERIVLERPENLAFFYDPFYLDRLAQVVKVDVGRTLVIVNVHFEAYNKQTRERQAETVLQICRNYIEEYPLLLIGDFNSLPPQTESTKEFPAKKSSGLEKEETIRLFLNEKFIEAAFPYSMYVKDEKSTHTFPSADPTKKIDYIFYNSNKIQPIESYVASMSDQASDHLPVVMRFKFVEE